MGYSLSLDIYFGYTFKQIDEDLFKIIFNLLDDKYKKYMDDCDDNDEIIHNIWSDNGEITLSNGYKLNILNNDVDSVLVLYDNNIDTISGIKTFNMISTDSIVINNELKNKFENTFKKDYKIHIISQFY